MEPESKAFETEIQNYQFLEKQHSEIDTAFEAKDYRKALFHVDQSLNIGVASKRLKVKKAECLAYLGKDQKIVRKLDLSLKNKLNNLIYNLKENLYSC